MLGNLKPYSLEVGRIAWLSIVAIINYQFKNHSPLFYSLNKNHTLGYGTTKRN